MPDRNRFRSCGDASRRGLNLWITRAPAGQAEKAESVQLANICGLR